MPFQPSLLGEFSFYVRRLRQEEKIRRLGYVLVILMIVIQVFSIIYPAKSSLATSANDIIYGASSKDQVIKAYTQNRDNLGRRDIRAIYDHYGIGLDQILASKTARIGSQQKDFISTGRATSPGIDVFIPIQGVNDGGIYQRKLSNWDTASKQNWYDTITGMSKFGFRFWIIIDGCGNIVFEQNTLSPNLQISKKLQSKNIISGGDELFYIIQFRNTGPGVAKNVIISDKLSDQFRYVSYQSDLNLKFSKNNSLLKWQIASSGSELGPTNRWHTIKLKLKSKSTAQTITVCNTASIDAANVKQITADEPKDQRCIKIVPATCPGSNLPIPPSGIKDCTIICPDGSKINYDQTCSTPLVSCQSLKIIESPTWSVRKFETKIHAQIGSSADTVNYYVNNRLVATEKFQQGSDSQIFTYDFKNQGTYLVKATLSANSGAVLHSQTCELSVEIKKPSQPEPMISTDKTVTNLTQNISDANNTTANPGDKLKYSIFIINSGDAPAINLELSGEYGESINDILEYADIFDLGDAHFNKETNFLTWDKVNIPPGGRVQKTFTVQVKNPLPTTPVSSSDPLSFDFIMQNKYGRTVVVKLDKPATKLIEQSVSVLPNTGPGSNMLITAVILSVVAYFYYRSRLLKKELLIVHKDYSSGAL